MPETPESPWKDVGDGIGCILFVIAFALLGAVLYHGDRILNHVLGAC